MGNISRRNFLKYAGLTGGVAGLASLAGCSGNGGDGADGDKIKIGVSI